MSNKSPPSCEREVESFHFVTFTKQPLTPSPRSVAHSLVFCVAMAVFSARPGFKKQQLLTEYTCIPEEKDNFPVRASRVYFDNSDRKNPAACGSNERAERATTSRVAVNASSDVE